MEPVYEVVKVLAYLLRNSVHVMETVQGGLFPLRVGVLEEPLVFQDLDHTFTTTTAYHRPFGEFMHLIPFPRIKKQCYDCIPGLRDLHSRVFVDVFIYNSLGVFQFVHLIGGLLELGILLVFHPHLGHHFHGRVFTESSQPDKAYGLDFFHFFPDLVLI